METSDHASDLPPNQLTNAGNLGPADLRARTRTLLEILTVLPEEVESYTLRLGENRRKEIRANLAQGSAPITVQFLNATLTHAAQSGKPPYTLFELKKGSVRIFLTCIDPYFHWNSKWMVGVWQLYF